MTSLPYKANAVLNKELSQALGRIGYPTSFVESTHPRCTATIEKSREEQQLLIGTSGGYRRFLHIPVTAPEQAKKVSVSIIGQAFNRSIPGEKIAVAVDTSPLEDFWFLQKTETYSWLHTLS